MNNTPAPKSETQKNGWWILVSIGTFAFMSNLDSSIVNIAMPLMAKQLKVPMNEIEWVVSSYLIVLTALLLFLGNLVISMGKSKSFELGQSSFYLALFYLVSKLISHFYSLAE